VASQWLGVVVYDTSINDNYYLSMSEDYPDYIITTRGMAKERGGKKKGIEVGPKYNGSKPVLS